jgi:hypothetical protein
LDATVSDPDDPWTTPRVDPRQKLPRLSPDGFRKGLQGVMTSLGVSTQTQAALGRAAAALQLQGRVDAFFDASVGKYKVGGVEVSAAPFFRISKGGAETEPFKAKVFAVTGRGSAAFNQAVHNCAYGRCSAAELQMVTQALIDKGKLAEVRARYDAMSDVDFRGRHGSVSRPLSDENAIKLLQWDYGLGVDCAGYVQQAFLDVHGGSRQAWDFHPRMGWEDLSDLKGNPAFDRTTTPVNVVPGDLIVLAPPMRGDVGHTVLVRERAELSADDARALRGLDSFAGTADKVHRLEVHGSWGADSGNLDKGGLQTRVFLYNETSGKWADVQGGAVVPQTGGPYAHELEGIYHPKRSFR